MLGHRVWPSGFSVLLLKTHRKCLKLSFRVFSNIRTFHIFKIAKLSNFDFSKHIRQIPGYSKGVLNYKLTNFVVNVSYNPYLFFSTPKTYLFLSTNLFSFPLFQKRFFFKKNTNRFFLI